MAEHKSLCRVCGAEFQQSGAGRPRKRCFGCSPSRAGPPKPPRALKPKPLKSLRPRKPRKRDCPCAGCGKMLSGGKGALPAGQRTCHECRAARRPVVVRTPRQPRVLCEVCGVQYRRNSIEQRTCSRACGVVLRREIYGCHPPQRTCQTCGEQFIDSRRRRVFRCNGCRTRICEQCGGSFTILHGRQIYCSAACRGYQLRPLVPTQCRECGETFTPVRATTTGRFRTKFCSSQCRERADGRTANHRRRVRLRESGQLENFTTREIAERDAWRCHLCGKKVSPKASYLSPGEATIDHLLPVSQGGQHNRANVALAHRQCNSERGATGAAQLRFVG